MSELLFNRKANATLASLCAGGRLPHALLLEGPAGSGKHTAARQVCRAALCEGERPPCGACAACVKVEKGVHPDVRVYGVPEGKKEFPVELVRRMRQDAYIAPNEGRCKLYLVQDAHAMNTAAQNALLKVLEEPPENVSFLLLCENRSLLLPTILSRVVAVELEVPTPDQCVQALEKLAPDASEAERQAAAAGAGGNIGQALELLGSAKPSRAAADARVLREALVFGGRYECLRVLAGYDKDRAALGRTLALLKESFAKVAAGREEDERFCNRVTPMQAVAAAQAVERAAGRAARNGSIPLCCACLVEDVKTALA